MVGTHRIAFLVLVELARRTHVVLFGYRTATTAICMTALGNLLVSWNELSVGYGSGDRGIYKTSPQILWQKTMVRLGDITVVVVG